VSGETFSTELIAKIRLGGGGQPPRNGISDAHPSFGEPEKGEIAMSDAAISPSSAKTPKYDAIVIGSGMGALAFAACMAKLAKWRVLILERHFKIGGFTHTFRRPGGWEWDVGLHYVGGMNPGAPGRRLFDFITDRNVAWSPMPEKYDRFVYPEMSFAVPAGEAKFREALLEAFPHEPDAIVEYFRDVRAASAWFERDVMAKAMPAPLGAVVRWVNRAMARFPLMTTAEYLAHRFRDPLLRAVVASQWADYGLPPSRSAFALHALVTSSYFDGAWYPQGGAGTIARACDRIIREAGGELLAAHEVSRILVEGHKAVGVEVQRRHGTASETLRYEAPVIVSDAGAWITYKRLLPAEAPIPFREELDHVPAGTTVVTLFLGLRRDPREMGFGGENRWIFDSFDHDAAAAAQDDLLQGKAHQCFLSFPSLKDPQAARHTAEVIAPLSYQALAEHAAERWRRRSGHYQHAKDVMAEALIELVEKRYPGFRSLIDYQELSTPLTFEHFTGAPAGAIYGYPGTPSRFDRKWLAVNTPVKNLYLTGADASSLGIMGALMGGVATASRLLGPFGFFRIMRAAWRAAAAPVAGPISTPRAAVG
jgi:phytoene dehydrogenase-like protein